MTKRTELKTGEETRAYVSVLTISKFQGPAALHAKALKCLHLGSRKQHLVKNYLKEL